MHAGKQLVSKTLAEATYENPFHIKCTNIIKKHLGLDLSNMLIKIALQNSNMNTKEKSGKRITYIDRFSFFYLDQIGFDGNSGFLSEPRMHPASTDIYMGITLMDFLRLLEC